MSFHGILKFCLEPWIISSFWSNSALISQEESKTRKPWSGIELATHDSAAHPSHSFRALLSCGGKYALGFTQLSNSSSLRTIVATAPCPPKLPLGFFLGTQLGYIRFPASSTLGHGSRGVPLLSLVRAASHSWSPRFFTLWVRKPMTVITEASEARWWDGTTMVCTTKPCPNQATWKIYSRPLRKRSISIVITYRAYLLQPRHLP